MAKDWIIDVLGDLRAFANDNDLPSLAHQLDEAVVVASVEIAQAAPGVDGHGCEIGGPERAVG